jgi:hypothetical protein
MTDETEKNEIKMLREELEKSRRAYKHCMSIFVGTSVAILSRIFIENSKLEDRLNNITITPKSTNNVTYLEVNNGLRKKFGNGLKLYYYQGKYLPLSKIGESEAQSVSNKAISIYSGKMEGEAK